MAPMIGVLSAVVWDPAGAIYQQSEELRRADMTRLAGTPVTETPRPGRDPVPGVTRRRTAGLLFVFTGPALYRHFALAAGRTSYPDG